jgi:hypothetical protein
MDHPAGNIDSFGMRTSGFCATTRTLTLRCPRSAGTRAAFPHRTIGDASNCPRHSFNFLMGH